MISDGKRTNTKLHRGGSGVMGGGWGWVVIIKRLIRFCFIEKVTRHLRTDLKVKELAICGKSFLAGGTAGAKTPSREHI